SMVGHVSLRWQETPIHLFVFFAMTLAGHRELYRARPSESGLTGFYLILSVGGAAGGVFVTLVAPAIFTQLHEYALSIALLSVFLVIGRIAWAKIHERDSLKQVVALATVTCILGLSVSWMTAFPEKPDGKKVVFTYRNYYGIHRVFEQTIGGVNKGTLRNYAHGTTIHGAQVVGDKWPKPLTYYHPENKLGQFLFQRGPKASNIAVVGLGAGSLASYNRVNDKMTFYELDPDNEKIARDYFDFLGNAKGEVSVVAGDARLTIHRDVPDRSLDILIVDAFSSDVVPVHLLTVEALSLYRSKLKKDGLLFFHVTNRIYDFKPVLFHTAKELKIHLMDGQIGPKKVSGEFLFPAKWMLFLNEDQARKPFRDLGWVSVEQVDVEVDPWTDDYASVLVLLWNYWKQK
ncbi:MAG: fused MFS/spermidine synthase, partial [Planctomycetota bacterium]|nr:fused MFS/spermidine synthase [Planctomycetota bacterium]